MKYICRTSDTLTEQRLNPRQTSTPFVWRKIVERNREGLMKKIHALLGQIDEVIAQEKASTYSKEMEFTPSMQAEMAGELRNALAQKPEPSTEEEKSTLRKKRRQLKELEGHREKHKEFSDNPTRPFVDSLTGCTQTMQATDTIAVSYRPALIPTKKRKKKFAGLKRIRTFAPA